MPYIQSAVHAFEPSYVRRPKQSFIGGTYQPLANDGMTNDPSIFRARHRAELYTQKAPLHVAETRKSIYTPEEELSSAKCDTDASAIENAQNDAPFADSVSADAASADSSSVNSASSTGGTTLQTVEHAVKETGAALTTAGHALAHAGHVTAETAKTVAHAVRTAAIKVRSAWHTFTSFKAIQLIIKFFQGAHGLWKKRVKLSYALYTVIFLLLTTSETLFMKWTIITEPTYASGVKVSHHKKIVDGAVGQLTTYVTNMWLTDHDHLFIVNFVGLALIYLVLIFVLNRFWLATLIFGVAITAFGTANKIKLTVRNEPILPADITFISSGNSGTILSFIPKNEQNFINGAITFVLWFALICIALFIIDGRRKFIHCSWIHPIASFKNVIGNTIRIIAALLSIILIYSFTWNLGIPSSSTYKWAEDNGYSPRLWDATNDAYTNGPATTFLSLTHVKAMDKPNGYNKKTMEDIAKKYAKEAANINTQRANNLTDSTVIMILSETFSDPTRVPGVSFAIDPIPNIRDLKSKTTSGLMLSPGYGGGTANIEYQALTGLNLANYDDSLIVPYQQLVPHQKNPYSFNQIWTERYGMTGSTAVHPCSGGMYLRNIDYQKFKFDYLYTTDSKKKIWHADTIGRNSTVSDSSSYQMILDLVNKNKKHPQFLQLITMQNHMPYSDWYDDNEFKANDTSTGITDGEKYSLDTYAKGINYTDQATAKFLNQLNQINKPITVVFYGDHLPGIYSTADSDSKNKVTLHETDYFIWSNNASPSSGAKLNPITSSFTSSNYFMAMAADHMNAKVSPYLAMLTDLHQEVPAMSRVIAAAGGIGNGKATFLKADGSTISRKELSKKAKKLLSDYTMVQYDQTVGNNYLSKLNFTQVP